MDNPSHPPVPHEDELPPGYALLATESRADLLLVRLMVGGIFLFQGVQRFLIPELKGSPLFAQHRIPVPDLTAPVVAGFELVCGALILMGLGVRIAVFPLLTFLFLILTRIRLPLLWEQGGWVFLSEVRLDAALGLGAFVLLLAGGGRWSLDLKVWRDVNEGIPNQGQGSGTTG